MNHSFGNKSHVYLSLLLGLISVPVLAHGANNDALDQTCHRDEDCRDFIVPELDVLSRCVDYQCLCTNGSSTLSLPCVPVQIATHNLVGGTCPCTLPYTTCVNGNCMCMDNFSPSPDKRRCIPIYVPVGQYCEHQSQCTRESTFSECNDTTNTCECLPNHALLPNSKCQGLVAMGFNCTRDEECQTRVDHSICLHGSCMCNPDFVAGPDNTVCLENVNANGECVADVQCKQKLGPGAACHINVNTLTGSCACDPLDFVMAIIRTGDRTQYLCENRKAVGDFCTDDIDCHQFRPANTTEAPPLECFLHECLCSAQNGYVQLDRYCVKRNGAAVAGRQALLISVAVALAVLVHRG